jgi:DNA-directed RNA polymerase specialized sigma24 family protein
LPAQPQVAHSHDLDPKWGPRGCDTEHAVPGWQEAITVNQFSIHKTNPLVIHAMGRRFPRHDAAERWPATIDLCRTASPALQKRLSAGDASLQVAALLEVLRVDPADVAEALADPPEPLSIEDLDARTRGWIERFVRRWLGDSPVLDWDVLGAALACHDAAIVQRPADFDEIEAALVAHQGTRRAALVRVARRIVRDVEAADEALSRAAAAVIAALHRRPLSAREVTHEGNLDAWLNVVVKHAALDHLRGNRWLAEFDPERDGGVYDDDRKVDPELPTLGPHPHDPGVLLELVHHREALSGWIAAAEDRLDELVRNGRVTAGQRSGVADGVRAVITNRATGLPYNAPGGFPLHALLIDRALLQTLGLDFLVITTASGRTLHQNATSRRRAIIDEILDAVWKDDQAA